MAATAAAPGISRKLKKILETRTDGPELRTCLEALSSIYPENTVAARRALRSTIDDQALEQALDFLSGLDGVVAALDGVQRDLDALSATCRAAQDRVGERRASGAALLAEHSAVQRQLAASRARGLRPEQLAALAGAGASDAAPPDAAFFEALRQVGRVRANCRGLMVGRHQRAALELMERMAGAQEAAYERLCRWVRAAGAALVDAGADADERAAPLRAALRALRGRPVLLTYCVDEIAGARHAALFQRFIRALTQGPRPIEVQAAEPRRYVGDMLAWVHAALELERDLLEGLLPGDEEEDDADGDVSRTRSSSPVTRVSEPTNAPPGDAGPPALERVLDKISESICRPLKVRLEQGLLAGPSPVLCYWMAQVLTFYLATLGRLLLPPPPPPGVDGAGKSATTADEEAAPDSTPSTPAPALLETLRAVRALALRAFREQVRQQRDKAARYPPAPPADLGAPPALVRQAGVLADLVACHDSAIDAACAAAGAEREGGFEALLDAAAEAALECVRASAEALDPRAPARVDEGAHLDPTDQAVYAVNCLGLLLAQVEAAPAAEALAAKLRLLLADRLARVLARCGLAEVAARVKLHAAAGGGARLVDEPGLALPAVAEAMREFFSRLSAPDILPEFRKLQLPRVREELIHRVSVALADTHAAIFEALMDPASGYDLEAAEGALKHTPAHVRTLLGLR
ncbi:hypothetical protein QBZ16_004862 [Prototheca wickerhamii]|uniref:Conserved oligomeric Golgi complex subunit 6 n=1 Tax=Prototheca wickerhamii TaxID=3111 RepID=A0AAD9IFF5_PROWI|nr:hypothetical protein QBZ16_004862 [Prototheca wickerhamii]